MSKTETLINRKALADALRKKREKFGLSQRDVERKTGVTASTVSRIERMIGTPDTDIIATLTEWLDIPIERVIQSQSGESVTFNPNDSTPEIVGAHLKKDKNLSPKAARALIELFRVAYQQMSEMQDEE